MTSPIESPSERVANEAKEAAMAALPATYDRLNRYLRVPAISCEPVHHPDVRKLCETLRDDLLAVGFDSSQVLSLPGALPMTVAEYRGAGPDKPTVLIYGHLDLQPVAGEPWSTSPHEPKVIDGRLYARGAADDMGGWVSHLAAFEAWFQVAGALPVNVRLVIEGEEEIGSPNLERYMDAYPEAFDADVMVLTDCENPSEDIPGLTTSLRGLMEVELVCEALATDVHSGLWGNMAPDPSTALVVLLRRLVDENGRCAVGRQPVSAQWREAAREAPPSRETIKEAARLRDGVEPLPNEERPPAEWLWRQPALTILSTTLPTADRHKNAIRTQAAATLSIRLAPGQTAEQMRAALEAAVLVDPPGGVNVHLNELPGGAESWLYTPRGPAFEAADIAYRKGFGRELLHVGIGGSIPFVALFGRRFGHLPLILNGVMDPKSGAHGPDESMSLAVFEKVVATNVFLLDELGKLPFDRLPAADSARESSVG